MMMQGINTDIIVDESEGTISPFLATPGLIIDAPDTSDDSGAEVSDLRNNSSKAEDSALLEAIQLTLNEELKEIEKEEAAGNQLDSKPKLEKLEEHEDWTVKVGG